MANATSDGDFLAEIARGKSGDVTKIGKGWRLEVNSDGRWRWRWQVKDAAGQPVTYQKSDGTLGYARGSRYVGITQRGKAAEHDRKRKHNRHKRGGRGKAGR